MSNMSFEEELKEFKDKLNPISLRLFYPKGEYQIDYLARSLHMIVNTNIHLKKLIEIYDYSLIMLRLGNFGFPFEDYSNILRKYGGDLDRYDIALIISFIRFGTSNQDKIHISTEELNSINKDAFNLLREFEIIENNTNGDEI